MTLAYMTKQETGIIIDGNEAYVLNWASGNVKEAGRYINKWHVWDIRKSIPHGVHVVEDANRDIDALFASDRPTPGAVFRMADGRKIIAPDGWK